MRRLAADDRLRNATYHWARTAAQRDPASHNKYQALRARGHGHARALRSVADRLLGVACAMLRDGACFDPLCGAPHSGSYAEFGTMRSQLMVRSQVPGKTRVT